MLQNKIDSVLNKFKLEEAILIKQKEQELKLKKKQQLRDKFISNAVGENYYVFIMENGVSISDFKSLNKKEIGYFTYWINYNGQLNITILSNMRTGTIMEVYPGYNPYSELKQ